MSPEMRPQIDCCVQTP
ncbi:hypothetical protein CGLO_14357 [Colletotrichum gloeosporioides Cg-14]|uniref:Uncharacterized protein n=1 Tax=Colletotrichum gloeosporioides (strain Cg-14) TaxID=1237896 RepID=T0L4U9_COLGC|nr:hypothetical protein CGLO_14357 [Colletotrichum gloeosporioides Cg-14]